MKVEGSDIIFESTGLRLYVGGGRIGIDSDYLSPSYGYDGMLEKEWNDDCEEVPFTQAEREELADYMIDLWKRFRVQ